MYWKLLELSMNSILSLLSRVCVASLFALALATGAEAQRDPCFRESSAVLRAERNLITSENFLDRVYANVDSVQNTLAIQTANFEARVAEAQARADAAGTVGAANVGGCIASGFFFGRFRLGNCVGGSVAAGIAQRARAQAAVRAAESRLRTFVAYAQNRMQREQQRIVNAQQQVARRQAELAAANNNLNQCYAAVGTDY